MLFETIFKLIHTISVNSLSSTFVDSLGLLKWPVSYLLRQNDFKYRMSLI